MQLPILPHAGSKLLYPHASGLEKALADASADRLLGIYAEIIRDQWDANEISENNLPFLAWAMGVNLWDDSWSVGVKRSWVGNQWEFQKLRGTVAAHKMALGTFGYDVVDVVRPPQGFYASPELTKEEYDSWIRQMPQIRIRFAKKTGIAGLDEIFADFEGLGAAQLGFADQDAVSIDDGFVLWGREAVLREHGVDTPLETIRYNENYDQQRVFDYSRVSIPGLSTLGFVIDEDALDEDKFVCFEDAAPRLVTIKLDRTYVNETSSLSLESVTPSLQPLSPRFDIDSDIGEAGPWFFLDDSASDGPLSFIPVIDGGDKLLAQRVYLLDPTVAGIMNKGNSFTDVDRVGIQSYTAELMVDLHQIEPNEAMFVEEGAVEVSFFVPQDNKPIERAYSAINAAKALRDTILVSFESKRPIETGDEITEATQAGDWIANIL